MDRKKSILNISISLILRILTMVAAVASTRCLIQIYGNAVNGLYSLYVSILGFLAVAELGIGSAITFCMYQPVVTGQKDTVSALYQLFRRWYLAVGGIILVIGLALTPIMHVFAKDYKVLDVNLQTSFVLMLISVVLTYLFGAKAALINAHKNNYITAAISSGGLLLQYLLQIAALYTGKSFSVYLFCRIGAVLVQWAVTEWVANANYGDIITRQAKLDRETRQEVINKIKAMFMHKVGQFLVGTVDSMVISFFVGVVALGVYSNYIAIQSAMDGLLRLLFTSLVSVLGHVYVEKGNVVLRKYFEVFHLLNFAIGLVFYLGYYAVIDELIAILFGEALVAERTMSMVIAVNGFVQFMRCSILVFRDATGTFYYDRWKPLAEGLINLVLSVILIRYIGVVGVIAATVLTSMVICHVVEPYVLYRHAFCTSPSRCYLSNYGMILLFAAALTLYEQCSRSGYGHWGNLLINGTISVGVSALFCVLAVILNRKKIAVLKKPDQMEL